MAKPQITLVSPHSLANYAKCLAAGFSELEDPVPSFVASPELVPWLEPSNAEGAEGADNVSPPLPPDWRLFLESACADADVMVVQLHGAHSEVPVLLAAWDYLCSSNSSSSSSSSSDTGPSLDRTPDKPMIVLLHRPEEIMERLARGLYPPRLRSVLFSPCVALVLLGPASVPLYSVSPESPQANAQAQRPPTVIPHGFFNCLPALGPQPPISTGFTSYSTEAADATANQVDASGSASGGGDDIAVIGSITTWSDMRWISDLVHMHRTMAELQNTTHSQAAEGQEATRNKKTTKNCTLFVAAGTFRPYKRPGDGGVVDELSCLKTARSDSPETGAASETIAGPSMNGLNANVEIVEGVELALACAYGENMQDQASLRQWLWLRCGRGARVCVLASPVPKAHDNPAVQAGATLAAELLKNLIDFNVQLYRELLKDFAPKVEYSGTLHESPGSSVPVVFESPSMADVASEGLAMLFVPTPPRYTVPSTNEGVESADTASESPKRLSINGTSDNELSLLFYAEDYYPNFESTCAEVLRLLDDPKEFGAMRAANAEAGRRLGFKEVASQYRALANGLWE